MIDGMRENLTPDQRADRLASRRHGLLTHADARRCGLSDRQISNRVATGRWRRLVPGLYVVAAVPESWQQRALAGCLGGPAGAMASHLTAAALHGFGEPSLLPHITVPSTASARCRLGRFHRSDVPQVDRASVGGIPVTSACRTVVDCAALLGPESLAEVVDQACCAAQVSPDGVLRAIDRASARPGRAGTALLRQVLVVWHERIRPDSPAEMRLLRKLAAWGVPVPVLQHEVWSGGELVARIDAAWPTSMYGLEYDSDRYHGPRRHAADERRQRKLEALGWRLDQATKLDLLPSSTRLIDLVRAQLARPAA